MRVLYLEDDEKLSNIVRTLLQDKLIIDIASNYSDAKNLFLAYHYDIVLLDRDIDGQDVGMNLINLIQRHNPDIGIIVLSAYSTIDDKINGLELGADDYMEKPYNINELHARIQALHRRNLPNIINIESMKFDTSSKRIFDNDSEIFLSNKENNLLFYLLINRNKLVSKEQLLHSLYLHPEDISSNTINVRINAIRNKLPIDIIKNIKTRGYIIEIK